MSRYTTLDLAMKAKSQNPYLPHMARIVRIDRSVADNHIFHLRFDDPKVAESFDYKPGQFVEVTVPGTGEAPISLSSSPTRKGIIETCVRRMGRVTNALYRLKENSVVGLRGPFGNGYPVEELHGQNILLIAGGLGMAPLRSLVNYVLDRRHEFKDMYLLYGARYPEDMLFKEELLLLTQRSDVDCLLAVEQSYNIPGYPVWKGRIGLVTDLFDDIKSLDVENTYAVICGPPIFYKFVLQRLLAQKFSKDRILMSLERRMECGIGKCEHCSIGYKKTCIDGPVFTYWDAVNLPELI
jgi:sulfhydrogenase subunit gamma (sulfur reductase)